MPPLTPVTRTEYVPGATPVVEIVNDAEPDPPVITLLGLKLTVAPAGKLETVSVTLPVNPPDGVMLAE